MCPLALAQQGPPSRGVASKPAGWQSARTSFCAPDLRAFSAGKESSWLRHSTEVHSISSTRSCGSSWQAACAMPAYTGARARASESRPRSRAHSRSAPARVGAGRGRRCCAGACGTAPAPRAGRRTRGEAPEGVATLPLPVRAAGHCWAFCIICAERVLCLSVLLRRPLRRLARLARLLRAGAQPARAPVCFRCERPA